MSEKAALKGITKYIILLYFMFYCISYIFALLSYHMIWKTPADISRETSWIYYGAVMTLFPHIIVGLLIGRIIPVRDKEFVLFIQTQVSLFLVEKIVLVLLAAIVYVLTYGGGGHFTFPEYGLLLLNEVLPFFSPTFFTKYLFFSTLLGMISYFFGRKIALRRERWNKQTA